MARPIKIKDPKAAKKKMPVRKARPGGQNISFKSIDEFLEFLPEDEFKTVELLRKIVFSCIPDCTEKLSYNVPFYKKHSNTCFIWPSSVTWGENMKQRGVRFGFSNGYRLQDEIGYLDRGNRKQVYWRDFYSAKEIDIALLKAYIFEAALIDEEMMREKRKARSIKG